MPRGKDPYWQHVTYQDDGKWKCNFCREEHRGGATRIKAHIAGIAGRGIKQCEKVDARVRGLAREQLTRERVRRTTGNVRPILTSTSNLPNVEGATEIQFAQGMQKCAPAGASSSQYDCTTVPHYHESLSRCNEECGAETSSLPLQESMDICPTSSTFIRELLECEPDIAYPSSSQELDMNVGASMMGHSNTNNSFDVNGALRRKPLCSTEGDLRDRLKSHASLSLKKQRSEVVNWLADVEKLRNDSHSNEAAIEDCLLPHQQVNILMQEAEDLVREGKFEKVATEARGIKAERLLERKMVGEAFQRNTAKIMEYLVGNRVSRLGIYGMGGVGKTTLMVHVHNRLLEEANYGNVLWITVSQYFNTPTLQDGIWKGLGLGRLEEKDMRKRAAKLSDCLMRSGKITIILDDMWECFDLEEVGIPVKADALKLVLTTRSFVVCRQMHCQEMIKIEPLSQKEAESLFLEQLGSPMALPLETKEIMKSIVKECVGLPLGVITMARSMRGVTDMCEWKDSLEKLRGQDIEQRDMERVVLRNLAFSYNRLGSHELQQCFLSCALYPEDKLIGKIELIEFFIDQGLIGGLNMREKQYDRGLAILNELENVCLLEDHGSKIKMHNLVRAMALHIMSVTSIVKVGKGLTKVPPEECWTDVLEKVSLMENTIGEFPLDMSPNCPRLSTFLLNNSLLCDVVIPDSFFKHLGNLKVLNLSGCKVRELPDSISDLVNLRALLLTGCSKLRHIPHLGKLRSLRKLDAGGCVCLEAFEDLGMLANLRYLDLTDIHIKRVPNGTLAGLLNLQYLKVNVVVNGEDITKLGALETLECYFEDVDDFNKYMRVIEKSDNPHYYELKVDQEKSKFYVKLSNFARFGNCERSVHIRKWSQAIVSVGGDYTDICILIPQDVRTLTGKECDGTANLSDVGPLKKLELLDIDVWKNLRVLYAGQDKKKTTILDSPAPTLTPIFFPSLRVLKLSRCPKLKYLFGNGSKFCLPCLQEIRISHCEEMVGITAAVTSPPTLPFRAFPSLTEIEVSGCDKMKRVVESEWLPHFPILKYIRVRGCENMEEIIGGPPPYMPVEWISLKSLAVQFCNNMRRLFPHELLDPLQNLQSIDVYCCKGMVEMVSRAQQGQDGSRMTPEKSTPSSFQSSIPLSNLKLLYLHDLPQLKSICEVPITCNSMKRLKVYMCPELNRIPLLLRLCDIEDLPYIEVEDEDRWKTLIWDHPDAQAILQPYILIRGGTYVLQGRSSH